MELSNCCSSVLAIAAVQKPTAAAMPRPGIHPVLHQMTVVLRNGASVQMMTTVPRTAPYFLRQDPTNMPLWTGKTSSLAAEDEHMAKFLKKYEGISAAGLDGPDGPETPAETKDRS